MDLHKPPRSHPPSRGLCRSEGIALRDMLSLGALGMGPGWPGKILPPSPSSSPPPSPKKFPKSQFSKVLRMGLPGGRNVTRPCTKVFHYPISGDIPPSPIWRNFLFYDFSLYFPIYPLTPIPTMGAVTYFGPTRRIEP